MRRILWLALVAIASFVAWPLWIIFVVLVILSFAGPAGAQGTPISSYPIASPAPSDVLLGNHGGTLGVGGTTSKFLVSQLASIGSGCSTSVIVVTCFTYGAVGNSSPSGVVNDDTSAVQAAINAAQSTGGVVGFPRTSGCYAVQKLYVNKPVQFVFNGSCLIGFGAAGGIGNPVFNSYPSLTTMVPYYSINGVATFESLTNQPVGVWFDAQNAQSFAINASYPGAIAVSGFENTAVRATSTVTNSVAIDGLAVTCSTTLNATLTNAITSTGSQTITVGSTTGLSAGATVQIEPQTSGNYENVTVTSVTNGTQFVASPTKTHSSSVIVAWAPNAAWLIGVAGSNVQYARIVNSTHTNCGNTILGYQAAVLTMNTSVADFPTLDNDQGIACNGSCFTVAYANGPGSFTSVHNVKAQPNANPTGAAFGSDGIDIGPNVTNFDVGGNYVNGAGTAGAVGIAIENTSSGQTTGYGTAHDNVIENTLGPGMTLGDSVSGSVGIAVKAQNNHCKSAGVGGIGIYSTCYLVNTNNAQISGGDCLATGSAFNYCIVEGSKVTSGSNNTYDDFHMNGFTIAAVSRYSGSNSVTHDNIGYDNWTLGIPTGGSGAAIYQWTYPTLPAIQFSSGSQSVTFPGTTTFSNTATFNSGFQLNTTLNSSTGAAFGGSVFITDYSGASKFGASNYDVTDSTGTAQWLITAATTGGGGQLQYTKAGGSVVSYMDNDGCEHPGGGSACVKTYSSAPTGTQANPTWGLSANGSIYFNAGSGSSTWSSFGGGTGTVTSVTGTSPISSSGGATPAISCATCITTAGGQTIGGSLGASSFLAGNNTEITSISGNFQEGCTGTNACNLEWFTNGFSNSYTAYLGSNGVYHPVGVSTLSGGVCPGNTSSAGTPCDYGGTGAPTFSAPNSSTYRRFDCAPGSVCHFYVNTSGASTSGTTWTAEF